MVEEVMDQIEFHEPINFEVEQFSPMRGGVGAKNKGYRLVPRKETKENKSLKPHHPFKNWNFFEWALLLSFVPKSSDDFFDENYQRNRTEDRGAKQKKTKLPPLQFVSHLFISHHPKKNRRNVKEKLISLNYWLTQILFGKTIQIECLPVEWVFSIFFSSPSSSGGAQ